MVPKGWKVKHLSELANKISDGIHKTPVYADASDVYFINGNNLKNGSIVIQNTTKYVDEKDAINHRKELGGRTLLMSINGTIGNLAYYRGENVVLGKSASYINVSDYADLDYIYYVLSSPKTQAFYESELTGTTIRNLSIKSIKSTRICTPPLPEQKKIARILSTWDKAITTTEQLLANSQQQKKALMQQLLTGKKRLLDENGVRFSGEWKSRQLKQILQISKGTQLNKNTLSSSGEFPVINGGLDPSGYTNEFNTEANTITISEGGNSCGYVGFQTVEFWCGGHCYAVKAPKLDLRFLFQLLKFNQARIMRLRVGSGLPNIQKKDLESLAVFFPTSSAEQQKIAAVLSAADQEIYALRQNINGLKHEKKALMQQLLTGKRRVKLDSSEVVSCH